jgi:hypothetical protein
MKVSLVLQIDHTLIEVYLSLSSIIDSKSIFTVCKTHVLKIRVYFSAYKTIKTCAFETLINQLMIKPKENDELNYLCHFINYAILKD